MFEVFIDMPAQAFLKSADKVIYSRLKEILDGFVLDPVPRGAKRIIESKENIFRFRSLHLRLLYRIDYEKRTLVVIKIEPLNRMYR